MSAIFISVTHRQQPPEWLVLSHVNCFSQREHVTLRCLHISTPRMTMWLLCSSNWYAVKISHNIVDIKAVSKNDFFTSFEGIKTMHYNYFQFYNWLYFHNQDRLGWHSKISHGSHSISRMKFPDIPWKILPTVSHATTMVLGNLQSDLLPL